MNFNELNRQFEDQEFRRYSRELERAEDEEERLLQEAEEAALDEPIDLGEGEP